MTTHGTRPTSPPGPSLLHRIRHGFERRKPAGLGSSLGAIIEHLDPAMLVWEPGGRIIAANRAMRALAGEQACAGALCRSLALPTGQALSLSTLEHGSLRLAVCVGYTDRYRAWLDLRQVDARDGRSGRMAALYDDSVLMDTETLIRSLSETDAVTALPNERQFWWRLEAACTRSRETGAPATLVQLGMVRQADLAALLGVVAMDALVYNIGKVIQQCFGTGALVTRTRPERFSILVDWRYPDAELAHILAEVRRRCSLAPAPSPQGADLALSTAVVELGDDLDEAGFVLMAADTGIKRARAHAPAGNYAMARGLAQELLAERTLESDLRLAIEHRQTTIALQPKFCGSTLALTGFEALLRWQRPALGSMSPARVIPMAERLVLIDALGHAVLQQVCQCRAQWRLDGGAQLSIAVNFSVLQFQRRDLHQRVLEELAVYGLDPALLEIELTESSMVSALRELPVQRLKIDQRFIAGLPDNPDDVALTRAILDIARHFHLHVTAEGVETKRQLAFLRAEGCDALQGYLLGRPMDIAAATRLRLASREAGLDAAPCT